jgi:glutathione S-transferase
MQMSGNCYKVRLAAHQLGIPLTIKEYGLHDGDTRVPLLELDDGRCLPESGAILFYLSEGSHLQPADKWARAEMMQWMFFEQYSHEPSVAVMRYLKSYATPEIREKRSAQFIELTEQGNAALAVMEKHLANRAWFAGDRYSIADIALYGYTHAAEEGGFELTNYRNVSAWLARVASQPDHVSLSAIP